MNEEIIKMTNDFQLLIKDAIINLKRGDYKDAYHFIMNAITCDPNRPEPQNLLGILYEFGNDNALARKHYRMAYVLDPTYRPSTINLERVGTLFLSRDIPVDYGEVIINENENVPLALKPEN